MFGPMIGEPCRAVTNDTSPGGDGHINTVLELQTVYCNYVRKAHSGHRYTGKRPMLCYVTGRRPMLRCVTGKRPMLCYWHETDIMTKAALALMAQSRKRSSKSVLDGVKVCTAKSLIFI